MCEGSSILLHVRCGGCAKLFQQTVALPLGRAAPMDGDLVFRCPKCEAPYAEVVAFKVIAGAVRAA